MIQAESQILAEHDPTGRHPQAWMNHKSRPHLHEESATEAKLGPLASRSLGHTQDAPADSLSIGETKSSSARAANHDAAKLQDLEQSSKPRAINITKERSYDEDQMESSGAPKVKIEAHKRRQSQVDGISADESESEKVLKLSPAKIHELTSSPQSLPVRALPNRTTSSEKLQKILSEAPQIKVVIPEQQQVAVKAEGHSQPEQKFDMIDEPKSRVPMLQESVFIPGNDEKLQKSITEMLRPGSGGRSLSTPSAPRNPQSNTDRNVRRSSNKGLQGNAGDFDFGGSKPKFDPSVADTDLASPMPTSIPVPPLSLPTYLQLELSSHRPSPLYIHRSVTTDFPYESSRVKIERLLNFLLLPYYLEGALVFGTLACFDAWLYTFTILPLRLLKSFYILGESWVTNLIS